MELFKAMHQWQTRPSDERFWGPSDAAEATREYRNSAVTSTVPYSDLRVEAQDGELNLVGKTSQPAQLTHFAMGQLCGRAKAPADFLRSLPATLAAQNLNHCLKQRGEKDKDDKAKLLLHRNGKMLARCFTGEGYQRVWNHEIFDRMLDMEAQGWRTPPARPAVKDDRARPATEADCIGANKQGLSIKVGDMIAPAGCYASDRDMFGFMILEDKALVNPLSPGVPLTRGFFVWNSEVGDKSFGAMTFLLDSVCSNHIVWGASNVEEIRLRHVGDVRNMAFRELTVELRKYADSSINEDQAKILSTQSFKLGDTKDEVLQYMLGLSKKAGPLKALNQGIITDALAAAENPRYGDPRTAWAVAQGLTEISQGKPHMADRVRIDRAAGAVLAIAF
jgi:hypothetical protein